MGPGDRGAFRNDLSCVILHFVVGTVPVPLRVQEMSVWCEMWGPGRQDWYYSEIPIGIPDFGPVFGLQRFRIRTKW